MLKKFALIFCLFQVYLFCSAQNNTTYNYAATDIQDSMKKNAHAVTRLDECAVEISSPSQYKQKIHQIITVLDKDADYELTLRLGFDKFRKTGDVDVRLYDKSGNVINKYRKKDFEIRNAFDGFSLATDDKIMQLRISTPEYPCTVEYQYELYSNGYLSLPGRYVDDIEQSTENFRFSVSVPVSMDIRYKTRNLNIKPEIQSDGKTKSYLWEAKNFTARIPEPNGYKEGKYLPAIEIAPTVFEYDGIKGTFSSWKDYGNWFIDLYENKVPFNDRRISEIKSMIPAGSNNREKIRILYNYLKKTMRYVSIQYGIGGVKPFTVPFVDEHQYGDCKALSNYMRYLLKVVDINSYPALINAEYNSPPADPSFPRDVFNHVILCVPQEKDTVWLECTSNHNDAGILGSFTENKNALLITEHGGVLVHTPKSYYGENKLYIHNDVALDGDGGAIAKTNIHATGDIDDMLYDISKEDTDRQKEMFVHHLNFKEPNEFLVKSKEPSDTGSNYQYELSYEKTYDFNAGTKYFLPQRMYKLSGEKLNTSYKRYIEYLFEFPYDKVDTTVFHLPENFSIVNLPPSAEINNEFGYYKKQITTNKEAKTITIIARLILKEHLIPAEKYSTIADFFAAVQKDEDQKILLERSESKPAVAAR